MSRFIHRPSPAMVVACIALFVAMGGVSYGLATGSISGREIRNNTIRGKDIRNKTITGKDVARDGIGGLSINEGRLGVVPLAEAVTHSVVITSGGAFRRGRGIASAARVGTGRYQVLFNRDVRGCVYVATVGDPSAAAPGHGTAVVASLSTNVSGVAVRTFNQQAALANRAFHLM